MNKTILVTGIHRSGTTWIGKVLDQISNTYYLPELFNPDNVSGLLIKPFERYYQYICFNNEDEHLQAIRDALSLKYPLGVNLKRSVSFDRKYNVLRRYFSYFIRRNILRPNIILKDPIALLSSEWLHKRFNMPVIILIRHPAAFTASIKRLNWRFSCKPLLEQKLLLRDFIYPFEEEIINEPNDLVGRCILFWRVIYFIVNKFSQKWPNWLYIKHEDISAEAQKWFTIIFQSLDIPMSGKVEDFIKKTTSSKNPSQVSDQVVHHINLDSKKVIKGWQRVLNNEEIKKIRDGVGEIYYYYYDDEDWN